MHEVGTHLPVTKSGTLFILMLSYSRRGWYGCLGVVWEWKTLCQWRPLHDDIGKDCIFMTSRPQDFETRDKNSIHTTGWRTVDGHPGETSGWPGCMEKRHDILRKASPRLKETEEYFMPGSLPVQPQVTMGSGLVDLSCDSGWDGASRCRTTVGLDEHRTVVRGTLRKTMFRSSCSQTPWSART
jgi:hypothetical protein